MSEVRQESTSNDSPSGRWSYRAGAHCSAVIMVSLPFTRVIIEYPLRV